MNRLSLFVALVLIAVAAGSPALVMASGAGGSESVSSPERSVPSLKDGDDDSGGGGDDSGGGGDDSGGGGGDDSSDDDSGGGNDDSGSDNSGSSNSGSDDDEIDDSGPDDNGGDDSGSDDRDNSGKGGGNDDFQIEFEVDDSDGLVVEVEDDDGNEATDGFRVLQAIVRLQPGSSIAEFNERHGTVTVAGIPSRDIYLLQLPDGSDEIAVERELAADPDTRWTELNFTSQAPEGRPGYFFVSGAPASPDAAAEAGAYAGELIGVSAAQACVTGTGVLVAVLDTGIDASHSLLAGRIAPGGWNALANSADVADTGNGRDDDGDGLVDEMVGHGTHVAGIIASVAPGAVILPVKVLNSDGSGDAFFVAAGIHYAVDQGAQVINLSLGSTYDARVIAEAIAEAAEAGVVVVAAAGNAGTDRPLEFPAANAGVIAVAATDQRDVKTEFSNYGDKVDLAAPGVDISSSLPGEQVGTWSGTSMAAPFVAGTAALVAEAHPSWSSPQITKRLLRTAVDLDDSNPDFAGGLGDGRLDVDAAVRCEPADAA